MSPTTIHECRTSSNATALRPHNANSDRCWCNPRVEVFPSGTRLVIHHLRKAKARVVVKKRAAAHEPTLPAGRLRLRMRRPTGK